MNNWMMHPRSLCLIFYVIYCIQLSEVVDGESPRNDGALVGLPIGPELKMEPYFVSPYFGSYNNRNISVYAGQTAFLECRVRNLGAKKVSWVRHRGVTILAVGTTTFTSDERISSRYNDDDGRFSLKIKNVAPKDAGTYECQISTKPTKVWFVHLNVLSAQANILGEKMVYVEINSELNLTCVVEASVEKLGKDTEIRWYKDDKIILDGDRISFSHHVETNKITSYFIVTNVKMEDSGNYTCRSSITSTHPNVKVHILDQGVNPNSWKTNSSPSLQRPFNSYYLTSWNLFLLVFVYNNGIPRSR